MAVTATCRSIKFGAAADSVDTRQWVKGFWWTGITNASHQLVIKVNGVVAVDILATAVAPIWIPFEDFANGIEVTTMGSGQVLAMLR